MTAYLIPDHLEKALAFIGASGSTMPSPEAVRGAHAWLTGAEPIQVATFADCVPKGVPSQLFRLAEAPHRADGTSDLHRESAIWSGLNLSGQTIAIIYGADQPGQVWTTALVPKTMAVRWVSDHAPNTMWVPAASDLDPWPFGGDDAGSEWSLRAQILPTLVQNPQRQSLPTLMELVLRAGSTFRDWRIAVLLRPMKKLGFLNLEHQLMAAKAAVQKRLTVQQQVSVGVQASITDPVAQGVVDSLNAWQNQLHEMMRTGGWWAQVFIGVRDVEVLPVMASAFSVALGPATARPHDLYDVSWSIDLVAPGHQAPGTWMSSADVAGLLAPPPDSIGNLLVRDPVPSGRLMPPADQPIRLGSWLGSAMSAELDLTDLRAHTFIAGITGSGKSTTARRLLGELDRHHVPCLVIDPVKSDYAELASHIPNLRVIAGSQLRVNALAPWPGTSVRSHFQQVAQAFTGAFGLPVPVPYVVTLLFDELASAAEAGLTVNLHDALARLDSLMAELRYAGEVESNIRAALGLRLRLLLNPSRAARFASAGAPQWLMGGPVVVQLSDLADDDERNFVASLLMIWVSQAARSRGSSSEIQHVTLVEEAHRIVPEPKTTNSESGDSATAMSKLMVSLLAEVRAFGEAIVIVDQSPAAVAREVLRNTSVKLAHRIVDVNDQVVLAGAMGLPESQSQVLGALGVGRVLVSSNRIVEPQTASVFRLTGATSSRPQLEIPMATDAICHPEAHEEAHHASEWFGKQMELAVAAYLTGVSPQRPQAVAELLQHGHPKVRTECLLEVGLRRHSNTLVRIGHLPVREVEKWTDAARDVLRLGRLVVPPVSVGRPGVHAQCESCLSACRYRSIIESGGLRAFTVAKEQLSRYWTNTDYYRAVTEVGTAILGESAEWVSPEHRAGLARCSVVLMQEHLAPVSPVATKQQGE